MAEDTKPAAPAAEAARAEEVHPGEVAAPPKNPWLCVMVVGFIGAIGLIALLGIIVCSVAGKPVPSELTMIGIGALTSLPGFMTVVPRGSVGYTAQSTLASKR